MKNDRTTVLAVIVILGLVAVASLGGVIALSLFDKPVTVLVGICTGSVGALAGLLANTGSVDLDGLKALGPAAPPQPAPAPPFGPPPGP